MRLFILTFFLTLTGVINAQSMEYMNNLPKVTVEASLGGNEKVDNMSLRRLVAMCNGNLYLRKHSRSVLSLHVSKVVEGSLYDPNFANRPDGVNNLEVIIINDVAIALDKFEARQLAGIWKLSILPNGAYLVNALVVQRQL